MASSHKILERYATVIAGQTTEAIKQAEKELNQLEGEPLFAQENATIICDLNNSFIIRKFAAVYLSKFTKKLVKQGSLQNCVNAIQQYLAILKSPHVEIEIKMLIVSPIQIIITTQMNRTIKEQLIAQYLKLLNEAVQKEDSEVDFVFIVFCGQSFITREMYNETVKETIKLSIEALIKLVIRLFIRVQNSQNMDNRENELFLFRIIKQYSVLMRLYFKRLTLLDIESMKVLYLAELETLITLAVKFNHKDNEIDSSMYASIPNNEILSKMINITKTNFIIVLISFLQLLFAFNRHVNLLVTNPLYSKIHEILAYFIKSTASLLNRVPYYQLPHRIMVLETLDEMLNLFISCLRTGNFYQSFFENKLDMIEKIVMPCLALTPRDVENFYVDSQQFIQNTLQIVGRDLRLANTTFLSNEEPEDEIKQYETLRTLSAEFLNTFCKYQDGTLSQAIQYALSILNGNVGQKTLMFLIVCILSSQLKERKDLKLKITQTVVQMIKNCPIPVINGTMKEQDLEYAYLLLTLSKIFYFAIDSTPDVINLAYKVGITIIQSPSVSEVHKFFVFEIFNSLSRIEEVTKYVHDILVIYNHILKNMPEPSIHLLDSFYPLIKYNTQELKKYPSTIMETVKYICIHIDQQASKQQPVLILLNKYWNIVRQIGECEDFVPTLIEPIQELIVPLLHHIDGVRNLDFEEDILMLLTSFIEKGKKVTVNQQKMFEIIPRIFKNQYNCRFGQSFHAIQLFIYYGSDVLSQNYPAIESIVDMSLISISTLQYNKKPMNQCENCQGALTLQSLILKCGSVFTLETWKKIIKTVQNRLEETAIKLNLLTSNLYALLSLTLVHSYKFFSNEDNQILMSKIISEMRVFSKIQYSPKVIIAGLTSLLLLSEYDFIGRRFTQILDTVITMLEITSIKKENYFEDEDDEEKEYANSIIMLKNDLKSLDEFTYFRQQVAKLKQKNLPLLQRCVADLPKAKKEFFIHILRIERVANEPRQIYKIKRS